MVDVLCSANKMVLDLFAKENIIEHEYKSGKWNIEGKRASYWLWIHKIKLDLLDFAKMKWKLKPTIFSLNKYQGFKRTISRY